MNSRGSNRGRLLLATLAALLLLGAGSSPLGADVDPPYELFLFHHPSSASWAQGRLGQVLGNLNWVEPTSAVEGAPSRADRLVRYTDICDWYDEFSSPTRLKQLFEFNRRDAGSEAGDEENDIIVLLPFTPASDITGYGREPGSRSDCARTVWNYKAAYRALAPIFAAHPDKLFLPLTTLPRSYWDGSADPEANMALTREFNCWLKDDYVQWYRRTYRQNNLAVFPCFDILSWGPSGPHPDYLRAEFIRGGWEEDDSRPNEEGFDALTFGYTDPDDGRQFQGFADFLEQAVDAWTAAGGEPGPPAGILTIAGGAEYCKFREVTLKLTAPGRGFGTAGGKMRFRNESGPWSAAVGCATVHRWTLSDGDGEKTVQVQFSDADGNWITTPVSATIILDTCSPAAPNGLVAATVR